MPNWCYTNITFFGEKENIESLVDKLQEARTLAKDPIIQKRVSFDWEVWLGNIALVFGEQVDDLLLVDGKVTERNPQKVTIPCRGELAEYPPTRENISSFSDEKYEIELVVESAWTATKELFDLMAEETDTEYVFQAEEPGWNYFVNTDTEHIFYEDKYIVNSPNTEELHWEYLDSDENLLSFVEEAFGCRYTSVAEAKEKLEAKDIYIYEFLSA